MSDYTPSWAGGAEVEDETPPEEQFGGGVEFHNGEEEEEAPDRVPREPSNDDPSSHGEPRHPSAAVLVLGEFYEEIDELTAHRCGGGYTLIDRYDDLPAGVDEGDSVNLSVYGIREGDTSDAEASVSSIRLNQSGRFEITYRCDGELPALDRWLDEGCLLCGGVDE